MESMDADNLNTGITSTQNMNLDNVHTDNTHSKNMHTKNMNTEYIGNTVNLMNSNLYTKDSSNSFKSLHNDIIQHNNSLNNSMEGPLFDLDLDSRNDAVRTQLIPLDLKMELNALDKRLFENGFLKERNSFKNEIISAVDTNMKEQVEVSSQKQNTNPVESPNERSLEEYKEEDAPNFYNLLLKMDKMNHVDKLNQVAEIGIIKNVDRLHTVDTARESIASSMMDNKCTHENSQISEEDNELRHSTNPSSSLEINEFSKEKPAIRHPINNTINNIERGDLENSNHSTSSPPKKFQKEIHFSESNLASTENDPSTLHNINTSLKIGKPNIIHKNVSSLTPKTPGTPILDVDGSYNEFRCYRGKRYSNVEIPEEIQQQYFDGLDIEGVEYQDRKPRYLAPDGQVYNKYYIPINEFEMPIDLYATTPLPDMFPDYETYEKTLLSWLDDVNIELQTVSLPFPTGRVYYRPQAIRKSKQDANHIDNEQWWEIMYTQKMQPTWDATLIPPEPTPFDFAFYEDYESAVKRWALLCRKVVNPMPPHPSQYTNILNLSKNGKYVPRTIHDEINPKENYRNSHLTNTSQLSIHSDDSERTGHKPIVQIYWNNFSEKTKKKIQAAVEDVLWTRNEWKQRYGDYVTPISTTIPGRICTGDEIQQTIRLKQTSIEFAEQQSIDSLQAWMTLYSKSLKWNYVILPPLKETGITTLPNGDTAQYSYLGKRNPVTKEFLFKLKNSIQMATTSNLIHQQVLPHHYKSLEQYYECEQDEGGFQVDFTIPDFDIGFLDLTLLKYSGYSNYVEKLINKIDTCTRLFQHYSWNYPTISSIVPEIQYEEIIQLLYKFISHPSLETFIPLFNSDAYFDTFMLMMKSAVNQDMLSLVKHVTLSERDSKLARASKTVRDLIFSHLDLEKFEAALNQFINSNNELTHMKVSGFVRELLQSMKGKQLLRTLLARSLDNKKIAFFYYITTAMTFFSETPIEVAEFSYLPQHYTNEQFGAHLTNFIKRIYCIYYNILISASLDGGFSEFNFEPTTASELRRLLTENIETLIVEISTYLHDHLSNESDSLLDSLTPAASDSNTSSWSQALDCIAENHSLFDQLFTMLVHQSKSISECAEFTIMRLLEFSLFSTNIKESLLVNGMFYTFRKWVSSRQANDGSRRMLHVKSAVSRIFKVMCSLEPIQAQIRDCYSNPSNIIEDCILKSSSHNLLHSPPLISKLITNFICDQFTINEQQPAMKSPFFTELVKCEIFQSILVEINLPDPEEAPLRRNVIHQGTHIGAKILAQFSRYALCLDMLSPHEPEKKPSTPQNLIQRSQPSKRSSSLFSNPLKKSFSRFIKKRSHSLNEGSLPEKPSLIMISTSTIQHLIDLISLNHSEYYNTFETRNFLFDTLRYLLKHQGIFNLRPPNFTATLLDLCSKGDDLLFNRNAWRLWYQILKYHPSDIEKGIFSEYIGQFIQLAGSSNTFVCSNALRYIGKSMLLVESSQPLPRTVFQSHVSHLKTGANKVSFQVKKFHNGVVMQLLEQLQSHVSLLCNSLKTLEPGTQAFQALVRVFEIIYCHSETKKLLEFMRRDSETRDALEAAMDYIYAPSV